MKNARVHLLNTETEQKHSENVNAQSANTVKDDSEQVKIPCILDDPNEVKRGRQTEVNSLKEVGVMVTVKRSSTAKKRVIRTRWVDRVKDGSVMSRLVLEKVSW